MAKNEPFLAPEEAVEFLAKLGLPRAKSTLAKLRCVGGGPVFQHFGRWPRYTPSRLREYAESELSGERRSTSERRQPGRPRREDAAPAALAAAPPDPGR